MDHMGNLYFLIFRRWLRAWGGGLSERAACINDVGYRRLAKESRGDRIREGILDEVGGSRMRVTFIGVKGNHGLSNGSKMDLVGDGVAIFVTRIS